MNYSVCISGAVVIGLVAMMGCSSSGQRSGSYIKQQEVCIDKKWYGYHHESGCPATVTSVVSDPITDRSAALELERQRLSGELEVAQRHNGVLRSRVNELEQQLAARDREIAAPR